jgi:hypothetical protein
MRTSGCAALAVNARYRQGPEEALRIIRASIIGCAAVTELTD